MNQDFEHSQAAGEALAFRCPRWAELPEIELYMDQLTGYINQVFAPLSGADEGPLLTKAMVNNYVKQRVIGRPTNKKYNKEQLAQLIAICALKQVFSIPDICVLLRTALDACAPGAAYDRFCQELEDALAAAFRKGSDAFSAPADQPLRVLVRRAALAWAGKVYVKKYIQYLWEQHKGQVPYGA